MTGPAEDRSPEQIGRGTEETRRHIGATLDEITHRLTPGEILDQMLARLRSGGLGGGESRIGRVLQENPVPVVMIGVAAAWLAIAGSMERPAQRRLPADTRPRRWPVPAVEKEILMAVSRENLVEWLRDARAMEDLAIETLERQAERLERHPELRARVEAHLGETRRQAERIDACLANLDGSTSVGAPTERGLPGEHQLADLLKGGTMIKNGIIDYTFEHFEIATYRALISAADEAREPEVARVCRENLAEEEAMADWLADHLPEIARQYLYQEAADRAAAGAATSERVGHETARNI